MFESRPRLNDRKLHTSTSSLPFFVPSQLFFVFLPSSARPSLPHSFPLCYFPMLNFPSLPLLFFSVLLFLLSLIALPPPLPRPPPHPSLSFASPAAGPLPPPSPTPTPHPPLSPALPLPLPLPPISLPILSPPSARLSAPLHPRECTLLSRRKSPLRAPPSK